MKYQQKQWKRVTVLNTCSYKYFLTQKHAKQLWSMCLQTTQANKSLSQGLKTLFISRLGRRHHWGWKSIPIEVVSLLSINIGVHDWGQLISPLREESFNKGSCISRLGEFGHLCCADSWLGTLYTVYPYWETKFPVTANLYPNWGS